MAALVPDESWVVLAI